MSVSAARAMIFLPVRVDPVNMIMSASSTSAAPVSPVPVATSRTSSGNPTSRSPSATSSDDSGVTSLGFITTEFPAISAGIASPKQFATG